MKYFSLVCSLIAVFVLPAPRMLAQIVKTKAKTVQKTASGSVVTSNSVKISLSLGTHTFSDALPFDVPFLIVGGDGADDIVKTTDLVRIKCYYNKGANIPFPMDSVGQKKWDSTEWVNDGLSKQYYLPVQPLPPNRDFTFVFHFQRKITDAALQTKLKTIINAALKASFAGKTIDQHYEYTIETIKKNIGTIEKQVCDSLKNLQYNIEFKNIDADHYKAMYDDMVKIAIQYETWNSAAITMQDHIAALKLQEAKLKTFEQQYEQTSRDQDKAANKDAMKKALDLFKPVYSYPSDEHSQDANAVKTFNDACAALSAQMDEIKGPKDAVLSGIQKQVKDFCHAFPKSYADYASNFPAGAGQPKDQADAFLAAISQAIYNDAVIAGTTTNGNFKTRANYYVSADLGVAVIPSIAQMAPYLGTNIYFRPVNKQAPLVWRDGLQLDKRFSALIGLTVTSLSKTGYRADLFGGTTFNLLTGGGFRITESARINGGYVWYNKLDPNPLITNKSISGSWFIALSFDIDVKTVFNSLFTSAQTTGFTN